MGYDLGRADGIYGVRTARAVAQFQREVGLIPDGACGPQTMTALRRLGRKVVGGRPQWLRESDAIRAVRAGAGRQAHRHRPGPRRRRPRRGGARRPAALDRGRPGVRPGRPAGGAARRRRHAGAPHPGPVARRAACRTPTGPQLANELGADLLISLHLDGHANPDADGVATYHYGTDNGVTSTIGERLAGLVQREIVARTGLRDCRTHAKTWDLLRLTRMPAVRVEVGYLTSPTDRARLVDPRFRDRVVEAIVAAVQRMYYPVERDVPTGSIDVSELRGRR